MSPHPPPMETATSRIGMSPPAINLSDITFGIKLEMVTSVCFSDKEGFRRDRIRLALVNILSGLNRIEADLTHPIPDEVDQDNEEEEEEEDDGYVSHENDDNENGNDNEEDDDYEGSNYKTWGVCFDSSVYEETEEIFKRYPQLPNLARIYEDSDRLLFDQSCHMFVEYDGVEVISRVFKLVETKVWTEHIRKALHGLQRGPVVNGTPELSGYHVHIGLGGGRYTFE